MSASLILAVLATASASSGEVPNAGFSNCGFEEGIEGWGVWYTDNPSEPMTRYPYCADDAVARTGKHSLRIDAADENGRAFVHRASTAMRPGARYAISLWLRPGPGLDPACFEVRVNCRSTKSGQVGRMVAVTPLILSRKREGQWRQRSGVFRLPEDIRPSVQLGLHLRGARGSIWIDDVEIREIPPEENRIADLWIYDPYRVELESAPLRQFQALKRTDAPILEAADRYNRAMVLSADVKEDVRRARRLVHYRGGSGREEAEALAAKMDRAEQHLAETYRAYGKLFLDRENAEKRGRLEAAFERQVAGLNNELRSLRVETRDFLAAAAQDELAAGRSWPGPRPPLEAGLPDISPDGRVNQLIFAKRSLSDFQEMELPLRFDPVQNVTVSPPKSPAPGEFDWSAVDAQWEQVREPGIARRSCLSTSMVVHDNSYTTRWLLDMAQDDPEILLITNPPAQVRQRNGRWPLNWWHPQVRQYARDLVGSLGRTFRDRDEFLFYVFQAECYGPYVALESGGLRSAGYGRYAVADFRRWLEEKYGTIDRLNARWRADYESFDAVAPPPDKLVEQRRHTGPLAAEFETWRLESYHDWRRMIYEAWKEADPSKPIVASHSQLYLKFNDSDPFRNCDLLGWHYHGSEFMPVTMLLHSISRYNGHKPLTQYENFWGCQEDYDRMGEELPRRHGTQRYIFRLTVWDRFLQVWWYAYTTGTYLTQYDGNYFDPTYALTTIRYRCGAMPVCFDKFRRLQRALLESQVVPSRIGVLSPSAAMRNNFPYHATQSETRSLFRQLFPRNMLYEHVPEEYFLDGRTKLDDFDVLILPCAVYLAEPLEDRILAWLRGGPRLLVLCGPAGVYDELGLPSGRLMKAVFGQPPPQLQLVGPKQEQWAVDPARPGLVDWRRVGESRAALVRQPFGALEREPETLRELISQIERRAPRAAADEGDRFEMVLREEGDVRYLCVINPDLDEPGEGTVRVRGTYASVVDLDYERGFPISAATKDGATTFPLRLAPGEATIIRLAP